MNIERKKLDVLQIFVMACKGEIPERSRMQITLDKEILTFKQIGYIELTYEISIENTINDFFSIIVPTSQFFLLLQQAGSDEVISISDKGLKFNRFYDNRNIYQLEPITTSFPPKKTYFIGSVDKLILRNIESIAQASNYAGGDGLDVVGVTGIVAMSTDENLAAVIPMKNDFQDYEILYVPTIVAEIFKKHPRDELIIKIDIENKAWGFSIEDVDIVVPIDKENYKLPNLLSEKNKENYEHVNKAVCDIKRLDSVLTTMQIVSSSEVDHRVFLQFEKDKITLVNKDHNISNETIPAEVDDSLVGHEAILSCAYLRKFLKDLTGTKAYIYAASPPLAKSAIRIEDESKLFKGIHILFQSSDDD